MIDTPNEVAIHALNKEMQRIKCRVPTSHWYLFGSITSTKRPINDLDLLVIYDTAADCITIRDELASICERFPIHLLLMTPSEEAKLNFIQSEGAVEISPL